jgi:hypothetical protein
MHHLLAYFSNGAFFHVGADGPYGGNCDYGQSGEFEDGQAIVAQSDHDQA